MIADEAFVAPAELYLPFPHQVSVFYPLITWALAVNNWRSLPFAVKQIFSGRKSSGVCGRTVLYCLIPIQVLWVRIRVFFSAAMTIWINWKCGFASLCVSCIVGVRSLVSRGELISDYSKKFRHWKFLRKSPTERRSDNYLSFQNNRVEQCRALISLVVLAGFFCLFCFYFLNGFNCSWRVHFQSNVEEEQLGCKIISVLLGGQIKVRHFLNTSCYSCILLSRRESIESLSSYIKANQEYIHKNQQQISA